MSRARAYLLLWLLFFLIAAGFGYPTVRYYDPRTRGAMDSAILYHDLVTGEVSANSLMQGDPWWFENRVLVPLIARPFYYLALGRSGSWDPVFFGLLVANALLMATAATGLVHIATAVAGRASTALIAALLLFVNFATPTFYMGALVDSVELLAMILTTLALMRRQWLWLPVIAAVAVTGKETFLPLGIAYASGWLLATWREEVSRARAMGAVLAMLVTGVLALTLVALLRGQPIVWLSSVLPPAVSAADYVRYGAGLLTDRGLWYVFAWLLPLAWPNILALPKPWRMASLAATLAAVALAIAGGEESVNRALMNVAGPLLCVAAALTLQRLVGAIERR